MPFDSAPLAISSKPAPLSHISSFVRPIGAPRFLMDEDASSAVADTVVTAPADTGHDLSISQAARALQAARKPKPAVAVEAPEPEAAPAEPESPERGDADPAIEPTLSEEPPEAEPALEEPPIERPRSWSKDDDDDWKAIPRARQERIAASELAREKDIRQRINDTAEKLKGVTAKEQQAEQVRQQYEGKLKSVVEVLEKEQLRDFSDIRTQADLDKMSADMVRLVETDPLESLRLQARLRAWDTHQQKLQYASGELQQAETRKTQMAKDEWTDHVQAENAKAAELIPELADKEKGPALRQRAADRLVDLGFTGEELNDLAAGKSKISVYDHRLQQLILSDLKLSDLRKTVESAKKAALRPAAAVVPPVQRPGVTQPRGAVESVRTQALVSTLNKTGSIKDALAVLQARRAQSR